MTVLTSALTELKNKLNLQYIDLDVGAVSLDNLNVDITNLAGIKTETCTSECVTAFNSVPHYAVPELPIPTGTITFGLASRGYTAISQPFSYSGTDATYYTATVNGVSVGVVTSPIELTDLSPSTTYTIAVTPMSIFGSGDEASTDVTTYALDTPITTGVGATAQGVITFGSVTKDTSSISQPFTYSGVGQLGFFAKINNGSPYLVTSPIELTSLTDATIYNIKVAAYNNGGVSTWYETNVQTDTLPDTPLGTITFGLPTITETTISQPFTYDLEDATHFIATVNGVSVGTVTSPIELTDLTADTLYIINVTPVNLVGLGNTFSTSVTTNESLYLMGVLNLKFEVMYIHGTDIDLIPPTHNGGGSYAEDISSSAVYNLVLNDITIGQVNLTNSGGSIDTFNYPSELTDDVWVGSPYSRYSKVTITLEQAYAIAANLASPTGVGFALVPVGTYNASKPLRVRMSLIAEGDPDNVQVLYFNHYVSENYALNPEAPSGYVGRIVFAYVIATE